MKTASVTSKFHQTSSINLLALTDAASLLKVEAVSSQSMQASVTLTPFLSDDNPSLGISCLPPSRLDSIMTPTMLRSPAESCAPTSAATLGWLLWSLFELPVNWSDPANWGKHGIRGTMRAIDHKAARLALFAKCHLGFLNTLGIIIRTL